MMDDNPPRFEDEHPRAAAFLQSVFQQGGKVKRLFGTTGPLRVEGLNKYSVCPCGSGLKIKFCHPGLADNK
jgi:hypothetical protein